MSRSWPPLPSVEDEVDSLAREHGSDTSDPVAEHGKAPSESLGEVDQYPIIQDVHAKHEPVMPREKLQKRQTSYLSPDVAQRTHRDYTVQSTKENDERRYIVIPGCPTNSTLNTAEKIRPRSKSSTRLEGDQTPRGRPNITRINTDLGNHGPKSTVNGQRRPPSPYSYRASAAATQLLSGGTPKTSMLSPETAATPRKLDTGHRRARSAHPDRINVTIDSSDSDNRSSHHRQRSRSRARPKETPKDTFLSADERCRSGRPERHRSRHRRSEHSPPRENVSTNKNHQSAHGNITPPQTPSLPKESPCTSAAEDLGHRRRDKSKPRQHDRQYSRESPNTSATEDSHKRWSGDERYAGVKSRRGSTKKSNKPQIDSSDSRPAGRFDPNTPMSARTSQAMEDYFQRALDDNQRKRSRYNYPSSAQASPFSSPPRSPPRTPRVERKTRDYYEANPLLSAAPKQRSRPPSVDENPFKPLTSLLSGAIGGSLAAKVVPAISRTSTTSLETPSSSSHSSLPSGQRSRKPSPVHEEVRPASRAGSTIWKEELRGLRMSTQTSQSDRPDSRAGSVASREENVPLRTSTYPPQTDQPVSRAGSVNESYSARASALAMHDERQPSRTGSYASGLTPQPPSTQRASSYSASYEQSRPRPSQRRTYSSTSGTVVMPASSQHSHAPSHAPSHLSQSFTSPIATDDVPTMTSPAEARTISFPICPREVPVTGFSHWYTIQGMQDFDICSTCMQVLGASSFRDYCIPSPYRLPTEAVACSLSRPWIRIAIARSLKDGTANINLLQNLNRLPPDVWPCPGKGNVVRKWYHITDPSTKMPISNFDVCTACVRSVELIFPELRQEKLFQRPTEKLSQERMCKLNPSSKHFYSILNELDRLARFSRKKDLRNKDITTFVELVKSKTRYPECQKDTMLATPLWHFIPGVPELTICEECFEEVVWPLKDKPVARDVQKAIQKVPTYRPDHHIPGVSCQLYSERMRKVFREAVARDDLETLKYEAQTRYRAEHYLQEKQQLLAQDMRAGIDRRMDMEKTSGIWKSYE